MARAKQKLTDTEIRNAKPKSKPYKIYDTEGLRLLIRPSGTKVWQYPYKLHGKSNIYTIGKFGEISSAEARKRRDEARVLIQKGIAPIEQKMGHTLSDDDRNSFGAIAREWLGKQIWVPKHHSNITRQLTADVFATLGTRPIRGVTRQELLTALQRIEDRDALDVAKRTAQHLVKIFDYAMIKGQCESNPATELSKIIKPRKTKHRPHVKEAQLPDFLPKLEAYRGSELVKLAMKLLMLTMLRPGELRGALWSDISWEKAELRIPAERMKMRIEHIVPLSKQALAVLEALKPISGKSEMLFPGQDGTKPISDVTLTKCLIILGYGNGVATSHGMRATASTILNERSFNRDWIECQLAHKPKDKSRTSYNHAEYLSDRRKMLEWYGDFLEKIIKR